jgi:hypothetical protein
LNVIYLIYFRCRLQTVYNLNYTPIALGVQSWWEITSGGTGAKKVDYHCTRRSWVDSSRPEEKILQEAGWPPVLVRTHGPCQEQTPNSCVRQPVDKLLYRLSHFRWFLSTLWKGEVNKHNKLRCVSYFKINKETKWVSTLLTPTGRLQWPQITFKVSD